MSDQCTEQRFLEDIAKHKMSIIRDDGVNRHVRFKREGSSTYLFDLITWPGYLCYCGDMGTYVFRRIEDMFEFFRTDRGDFNFNKNGLSINPGYWGEKLESVSRFGEGFKAYSQDKFKSIINERVESYILDEEKSTESADSLKEAVDDVLSCCEFEHDARQAANDFEHEGFSFHDFWESDLTEYTYHFIWCCYALAWAVKQYDEAKEKVMP